MTKKILLTILVILLLAVGGYYIYNSIDNNVENDKITEEPIVDEVSGDVVPPEETIVNPTGTGSELGEKSEREEDTTSLE